VPRPSAATTPIGLSIRHGWRRRRRRAWWSPAAPATTCTPSTTGRARSILERHGRGGDRGRSAPSGSSRHPVPDGRPPGRRRGPERVRRDRSPARDLRAASEGRRPLAGQRRNRVQGSPHRSRLCRSDRAARRLYRCWPCWLATASGGGAGPRRRGPAGEWRSMRAGPGHRAARRLSTVSARSATQGV